MQRSRPARRREQRLLGIVTRASGFAQLGPTESEDSPEGIFVLFGEDVERFDYRYPGVVYVARPLPQGEYKVFWGGVPIKYIPCDGWPDEEKESDELAITVIAPAGALHEAFFDPVALSGGGVGATGSSGVIDPDEFTVGSDDVEMMAWSGAAGPWCWSWMIMCRFRGKRWTSSSWTAPSIHRWTSRTRR